MTNDQAYKNAVLDDKELQQGLKSINPKFGDFVTRVAGEAWGLPLIDQKTKALIAIAIDVVNQGHRGAGNPFPAHVNMAIQQGVTREEIEELLLFMCAYAGFNKVAGCFGALNEIFQPSSFGERKSKMVLAATNNTDYSARDLKGKVAFYVLLWKRQGINLELFDNYWKDVHGPVCARLPGQYQYWQFHLAHNEGGIWPNQAGIEYTCEDEDQFDGIAELTFESEADRQTWFKAAAILMDDEHNVFSKAIGYNTSFGNSKTYVDKLEIGDPNGALDVVKFHVMVKKADAVSVAEFRKYMTDSFASAIAQSELVMKYRLHLFEEVDNSRPDAFGVAHSEPPEKNYQAAFEIAFANHLEMEKFFTSKEYASAVKDQTKYVKQLLPFPERTVHTFVYNAKMTLAGQRSSKVAQLINDIGATNQLQEDVVSLMSGQQKGKSSLGHYLQGVQHFGITVYDMAKAMEFYTEVLGGKVALLGNGFTGSVLQNTLFQKEEIDSIEKAIEIKSLGVPNLEDGLHEALDVRFISFGNTAVELIHFRDAKLNPNAPNVFQKVPSSVGYANVSHLSFHVKDDVDLNQFAKMLEEECQARGLTEVVCNGIIHVKSHEERRNLALKYAANKFWNEPEYFVEGYSDSDFGDFHGWSLFYCKGPNGEQLEFNQVTRTAKDNFKRAQKEYNEANKTNFQWVHNTATTTNTTAENLTNKDEVMTEQTWDWPHTKKWPKFSGKRIDIIKKMFLAGESINVHNFVQFYTDDALYQFGNFPVVYGPQAIKDSSAGFIEKCEGVHHHINNIWEVGEDTAVVEMDVTYIRHDGKVFTLPCCDTIRFKGDKIQELRIFMDITPVFAD
ncbi:MAG TPA: EthD domain-containing protein [Oculatellaceae cyanobacterium]|jgi:alkylhydroperoxidase/carboxymuconolactone decarboxylase family protein YurZ/catechol 2,3-dioxygenase-like lactoylglutathione lyase family enzyme/ketosteroid isomerase-like protein